MFQVPQGTAARDLGDGSKVVRRRRRTYGPFKRPRVPRIIARPFPLEVRNNEICDENKHSDCLNESANTDDQVERVPPAAWLVGVDTARHPQQSRNVHQIKCHVKPDQKKPEMEFAKCLVQHPPRHLRVPVVDCGEDGKHNPTYQRVMEMRNDEIRQS